MVDWYPKLMMWYRDAHKEKGYTITEQSKEYIIFPESFYKRTEKLCHEKIYDYCFIGSLKIDDSTIKNRSWILDFINKKFTEKSYLQFTDSKTKQNYQPKGSYDYTMMNDGLVPKETPNLEDRNIFDEKYYKNICQSKFCLCPAGDSLWSMRFYEAIMCKTIPIVSCVKETYRSPEESLIGYKYYLTSETDFVYREDWVLHNYNLFLQYHTLEKR